MAAWVKPEKLATQYLIKKATMGATNGYELSLSSAGKVFVRFNQSTGPDTFRINSLTTYPTNGSTWMHVAATYDGTTIRLYVNGVQEGGNLAGPASITTNNLALGIGAQPDGTSKLQGAMDDVLLYNTALSASEIAALAGVAPGNTPPTLNPVGNKSAQVGSQLAFTATATDPDAGDTLTFSLANGTWVGACGRVDHELAGTSRGRRLPARWGLRRSMSASATAPPRTARRSRSRSARR